VLLVVVSIRLVVVVLVEVVVIVVVVVSSSGHSVGCRRPQYKREIMLFFKLIVFFLISIETR
jgi:hypothetical protein